MTDENERIAAELEALTTRLTTDIQAIRDGTLRRLRAFELANVLEDACSEVRQFAVAMPGPRWGPPSRPFSDSGGL